MTLVRCFDANACRESILYIIGKRPCETAQLYAILYLADKRLLSEIGQQLCWDSYVRGPSGPIPRGAVRALEQFINDSPAGAPPLLPPCDEDYLSEAARESLDAVIEQADDAERLAKDEAYCATKPGHDMALEAIIHTLPDAEMILDYVTW